jgi:hypothetical protein
MNIYGLFRTHFRLDHHLISNDKGPLSTTLPHEVAPAVPLQAAFGE